MSAPLDASASRPIEGGPSFSLRHRLFRLTWLVSWALLASWTPPFMHRWRVLLLNAFGARVHRTAHVYSNAAVWYPPHLEMGEYATLGSGAICYCMAPVRIGPRAIVSQRAHLCAGSHDIDVETFQLITKEIVLGAGSWIAAEAFVGPGVTVGDGAVLGARGVTVKNLEAWTVYAGNPARKIRSRIRNT